MKDAISLYALAVLLVAYLTMCAAGLVRLWRDGDDELEEQERDAEARALNAFADDPQRLARRCGLHCADCNEPFLVLGGSVWCGRCDPTPGEVLARMAVVAETDPRTLAKRQARRAARRRAA